ncbi:MAG: sodium:alanine symporter family protein [Clostridia bacterium]|nr:sodium:alanine symporter family protein [Clostridia bacterium]
MQQITEFLLPIVQKINAYLSDYILIILLIGTGLFYSIRTRFVQVRCFGEGMKRVFGGISLRGGKQKGGLSSFQALATAIAAQVGTGNIVGACGAILIGGPGAIFWMWIIAFFGMATIYAEAVLAQTTKVVQEDGSVLGGPVYYIRRAFRGGFGKFLAVFFAVAITLALGFMGSMVQSNSISEALNTAFNVPTWVVGLILAALCAFIFIGGIQRIASVAEKIVPLMAVAYLLIGLVVLGINITKIPETFGMIFKFAFTPQALLGGTFGAAIKAAISQGAKRGLFSNEAGMGSTPHAHAQAKVKTPHEQGVVAMIGVFIDTFIVLTITALVTISTLYAGDGPLGTEAGLAANTVLNKSNMMQTAVGTALGSQALGNILVAICLTFFAFTTIIGWNFFGKQNVQYLFGKKATIVYSVLAIGFIFLGSLFPNDLVWELADMFNNIMVIPNVIALLALSGIVAAAAKGAKTRKSANKSPALDADAQEQNTDQTDA